MRIILFAIFFLSYGRNFPQSSHQNKSNLVLSSDISVQKMDAFFNIGIKNRINLFELGSSVGFGIEKTIFQKQFAPHLECFSFFNLFKQKPNRGRNIFFGPGILISATTNRINTTFRYGDIFLCYQVHRGKKIQLFHQLGYGLMIETFNGNFGSTVNRSYNYFVKFGLSYAPDR
jgi:hypothetical protein